MRQSGTVNSSLTLRPSARAWAKRRWWGSQGRRPQNRQGCEATNLRLQFGFVLPKIGNLIAIYIKYSLHLCRETDHSLRGRNTATVDSALTRVSRSMIIRPAVRQKSRIWL